ncbi:GAF and ANTAR domain-containing protein [Saccharopolyspora halophila]|uniref:GAF and ANTAR domain-containing protein n=1 Tax=Saccharopolyspora halophila TaxID=405551 RepID=A0ABP5TGK1_9PSEU
MTVTEREQRLAQTFVALSDTLVDDFDVMNFLSLLTERAAELLDVTAVGVIVSDQRGGWHPAAASNEDVRLLELFASQTREGPCQDCIRDSAAAYSADLETDRARWPSFAESAAKAGFRAAAAVPMRLRRETIGALTLLNRNAVGVSQSDAELGQAFADVATVGILHQRAAARKETVSEQLQATLHHRVVIEQAKGVLAESGDLSMQNGFELLRDYARSNGQGLTDLAHSIADRTIDPHDLLTAYRLQQLSS